MDLLDYNPIESQEASVINLYMSVMSKKNK